LERDAELSHHNDIKWNVQGSSDLGCHGDPATGKTENDEILPTQMLKTTGQLSPGVGAVGI
jgi:hypothetical protein